MVYVEGGEDGGGGGEGHGPVLYLLLLTLLHTILINRYIGLDYPGKHFKERQKCLV